MLVYAIKNLGRISIVLPLVRLSALAKTQNSLFYIEMKQREGLCLLYRCVFVKPFECYLFNARILLIRSQMGEREGKSRAFICAHMKMF